ncbi:hypothetical protein [Phaeobacter sp.]|uniref:hypothetical protein n=1 Tax=Phaeobacter sp. TaxID=1902409 RepID=UPI0025D333FB|nr:hypothetical protein [Phaeobacter sp.]
MSDRAPITPTVAPRSDRSVDPQSRNVPSAAASQTAPARRGLMASLTGWALPKDQADVIATIKFPCC